MHQPEAKPRDSIWYNYRVFPFRRPAEMDGAAGTQPVVVVGAGPIGLMTALNLARFGVPSVVLEAEQQVSHGSRAIVLTRRSMEIIQQAGVAAPFLAKGLPWSEGRSFYRGREVYHMVLPHDPDDRFAPGLMAATLARDAAGGLVRKAGIMAVVVAGGAVRAGDSIGVELPAQPWRRLEPV